jgi:hypothetical protein
MIMAYQWGEETLDHKKGDKFLANQWEDEILATGWEDKFISNQWKDKTLANRWEDEIMATRGRIRSLHIPRTMFLGTTSMLRRLMYQMMWTVTTHTLMRGTFPKLQRRGMSKSHLIRRQS